MKSVWGDLITGLHYLTVYKSDKYGSTSKMLLTHWHVSIINNSAYAEQVFTFITVRKFCFYLSKSNNSKSISITTVSKDCQKSLISYFTPLFLFKDLMTSVLLLILILILIFSQGIKHNLTRNRWHTWQWQQRVHWSTWELFHAIRYGSSQKKCHYGWETWELLYKKIKKSKLSVKFLSYLLQLFINYIH